MVEKKKWKNKNVDTDTQSEIFDKNNTIVHPHFDKISKTIQSMLTIFKSIQFLGYGLGWKDITLGKDGLNRLEKSGLIYKLIYRRCKVTYVGQTGRLLNTRV